MSVLSSLITLIFIFSGCSLNDDIISNENTTLNTYKSDNEVDSVSLLNFLKDNISIDNTVDEIINVFEEMCKTPVEEDLLLLEYGVYDFTGEELFYFDLVRQYPDGEDEYYQLRVSRII